MNLADWVAVGGLILTVAGLAFAGWQLWQNRQEMHFTNRVAKAQFLSDVTEAYFGDTEIVKFVSRLDFAPDSSRFVFEPADFAHSIEERHLDKLLYTYDLIGQLVKLKMLTTKEVRLFAFQASRVLQNKEVQKYLAWLEIEYRKYDPTATRLKPHEDALYLAETLQQSTEGGLSH